MITKALIIFILTYILLLVLPKYRAYIALASAAVFVVAGILPINEVLSSVDWNVILMIAGTMGVVCFFIESRMPSRLADIIIEKVPDVKWAIIALSLFASLISAFVDNVVTVLMVAPVAITISKKLNMSPVKSISIAKDNVFIIYSILVWASVLFSAFIDNIPYVATMLPVVEGIGAILGIVPRSSISGCYPELHWEVTSLL